MNTHGHGEEALKLPEHHLLPRLGRYALQKQLSRRTGVQVGQESVDARLSETGELFHASQFNLNSG